MEGGRSKIEDRGWRMEMEDVASCAMSEAEN
jgi:hypothetical protein